ncbi:MAG: peptidylprolyl isomerase [Gemmatimonadales bacterium]
MSRTLFVACLGLAAAGCGDEEASPNVVARAGDYELTVDDVVRLVVDEEQIPVEATMVESLAELWIDYTLLAEATAEDSTYRQLDLEALVRQRIEQEMVLQLRDSVIQVDTSITADELRTLYAAEAPAVQIHARHIMMTPPLEATPAQRDSVRAALERVRARIVGGASFEQMAAEFSQDPGSARNGGDLGFFARGDMVQPFEDAVMALEPGEVSGVVETPMGLHLIRVEERRVQDFEEIAPQFRASVLDRRVSAAESTFVAGLEGTAGVEVAEGALDVTRELARNPNTSLSGRAARRALVSWDGGEYSAGELLELLRFEQPSLRENVAMATDAEIDDFLRDLGRRDLLVTEARNSGLEASRARVDSLTNDVRGQLLAATSALGLRELDRAPGESLQAAVERAVLAALADNLAGTTRIIPLGLVGFQLREGVDIAVFPTGVGQALLSIGQIRAGRSPSPLEQVPDTTAGEAADSAR